MLVFLTKDQAQKKRYRDFRILLVSYLSNADEFPQEKIFPMEQLIPPMELMQEYLDNSIDKKTFKRKYFDYLKQDTYRITLSYIIYDIVRSNRDYGVTCSDEEYDYGYMPFLSEFINKLYGINVLTHKAYKELDLDDKKVILHMNSIPEEIFDLVQHDVREGYEETKKKKKKKDKKKNKKKDKKKDKKKEKENENKYFNDRLKEYGYNQIMEGSIPDNEEENATQIKPRKIFRRIDE